jgi:hypothetical protein
MSRLHLLHHRRLLPDDRRLAGRFPHMRPDMVLDAIERVRWNRGLHHAGLRCHSAAQLTSTRYGERLAEIDATPLDRHRRRFVRL